MMWNAKHEGNYLLCKYITEIKMKKILNPFLNCPYKVQAYLFTPYIIALLNSLRIKNVTREFSFRQIKLVTTCSLVQLSD